MRRGKVPKSIQKGKSTCNFKTLQSFDVSIRFTLPIVIACHNFYLVFMKKLLTTALLLSLNTTFAYELISFSSTTPRTVEEILAETGVTRNELAPFICENDERYKLFSQDPIQNMQKNSLKIIDQKKRVYTYIDGQLFNAAGDRRVGKIRDKFVKVLMKTMKRLEQIPETKQLIDELSFSPYPLWITLGGNQFSPNTPEQRTYTHGNDAGFISMMDMLKPMIERLPFGQIGFGGLIRWNPKTKASFIESDFKKRQVDVDLILVHEMYHAYDGIRGLLDRRFVKAEEHEHYEFQPVCEFRAVRMENITRKAMGYLYRRFYSDNSHSDNDMLTESGEPEVLPTPCVNWL